MHLNPYIAGNPVGGEAGFFGREDIFREVLQVPRHPQSNAIVLYGQRRIGKTSVLLQLQRRGDWPTRTHAPPFTSTCKTKPPGP